VFLVSHVAGHTLNGVKTEFVDQPGSEGARTGWGTISCADSTSRGRRLSYPGPMQIFAIDWTSMLSPKIPLLDVVVRSVAIYVVLQIGMRALGRQNMQQASAYKMITLFLVGALGGRAVLGEDVSMTSCVLGFAVVVGLNAATAWAIYHSPRFAEWMEGPVVHQLIRNGIVQENAMHATKCTMDVIAATLRGRGETDMAKVQHAFMERHGVITIILDGRFDL
jgi:hypothetical protein